LVFVPVPVPFSNTTKEQRTNAVRCSLFAFLGRFLQPAIAVLHFLLANFAIPHGQPASKNRQNHQPSRQQQQQRQRQQQHGKPVIVHLKTKTALHREGKKLCAVQAASSSTRRQLVVNSSSTRRQLVICRCLVSFVFCLVLFLHLQE
jgi:hypothetical protein